MPRPLTILAIAAFLTACATHEVPIPRPVIVPGPTQYVPLPDDILAECAAVCPDLADGIPGGELLEAYRACRARAECRDSQVGAIRRLQPGR